LEASLSLRDKQENNKKRHYKALIEKADNLSDRLQSKMTALKTEEAQWLWKRHKQCRQLQVEKEALDAKKSEVSLAGKRLERKQSALTEGCAMLERKEQALGTVRLKLVAEKKVDFPDTNNSNFLFACFPFADATSFVSFPS
jgi:hypothetical protein